MLLNGILNNSEAWHGVTKAHIKSLEAIDEALVRGILNAHRKTPVNFLYLEVGATPIRWIVAQRRISFLHHIMCKENNELVKKVLKAQKENPTSGDYVKLVEQYMEDLNITYTQIQNSDKVAIKASPKKNATFMAFNSLKSKLMKHKKVKHIHFESLKIQPYLRSNILHAKEKETITALRSKCVRNVRINFTKVTRMVPSV